jgi:hypothetical protein
MRRDKEYRMLNYIILFGFGRLSIILAARARPLNGGADLRSAAPFKAAVAWTRKLTGRRPMASGWRSGGGRIANFGLASHFDDIILGQEIELLC